MIYPLKAIPGHVIDDHITGHYGEDFYGNEPEDDYDHICQECGCDIRNDTVFDFERKLLCTDCFANALVNKYADEYETTVEDYYGKH